MRYLDPKNDLTFKKIFGEHPHLLKSFLNAVMPLDEDRQIVSLEYLPAELVPEIPVFKNSIVDVRCIDTKGHQFIVEMQMLWTDSFKSRVLFNSSKAYVKQINKGYEYSGLKPVYSLSIINENFEDKIDSYLHHYKLVHAIDSENIMEGLEFVFIELPKFKAKQYSDKRLQILWLRFLSEINDQQENISSDFLEVPEIKEAIDLIVESGFTKEELESYDKYWDYVSTEKSIRGDATAKGYDKGKLEGIVEGKLEGIVEAKQEVARNLIKLGMGISEIAAATGLSKDQIELL